MSSTSDRQPSAAEIEQWERNSLFLPRGEVDELFPSMRNLSAAFEWDAMIRPLQPEHPEYVTVDVQRRKHGVKAQLAVATWNTVWEAAQFRRRMLQPELLVGPVKALADQGDCNFIIVPRTESRYFEYAPLVHLLPVRLLEQFDLPILKRGLWPYTIDQTDVDKYLPADFEQRLGRAWAAAVWPHLNSGSPLSAFSKDDPVRLLAHNLDYWIPPVTAAIQNTLRSFGRTKTELLLPHAIELDDGSLLKGAVPDHPLCGGTLWAGEEDAARFVAQVVEEADATGNLRGILDAVRSHRAHDDFSPRWSHAREDFERTLNHSRAKVKVLFVEVPDVVPVQSPEAEVLGNLVASDFLTLLDAKERQVVVLLMSGLRQHEAAEALGYANHSAVSKKLATIRDKARRFFDALE